MSWYPTANPEARISRMAPSSNVNDLGQPG